MTVSMTVSMIGKAFFTWVIRALLAALVLVFGFFSATLAASTNLEALTKVGCFCAVALVLSGIGVDGTLCDCSTKYCSKCAYTILGGDPHPIDQFFMRISPLSPNIWTKTWAFFDNKHDAQLWPGLQTYLSKHQEWVVVAEQISPLAMVILYNLVPPLVNLMLKVSTISPMHTFN